MTSPLRAWPAVAEPTEPAPYAWPAGTGPDAGHQLITVPICPDCGALPGDEHTCAAWAAECWNALSTAPIILPPHGPLTPLVDPALQDREAAA